MHASHEGQTDETSHHGAACLLFLALFIASPASAQDCSQNFISLHDQLAVNSFQANYGPCTRVPVDLNIEDFSTPGNEIVDLSPLAALTEVANILFIGGTSVTSLAGLESLASVNELFIHENLTLVNLTGLSALINIGSLSVQGNNLNDLGGLSSGLTSLDSLLLGETHLSGLPQTLTQVRRFYLGGSAVTHLSGLPAMLQSDELSIRFTTDLTSLNGLPLFQGLKFIWLEGNEALTDISALAASVMDLIDPAETYIRVEWNFNLTSLTELPAVARLGVLEVANNANLTTLGGPAGLQEIWSGLSVTDNSKLADCSILRAVLDQVDDGDPGPGTSIDPADPPDTPGLDFLTIGGNKPVDPDLPPPQLGCDSISEILTAPAELIYADGFEGD